MRKKAAAQSVQQPFGLSWMTFAAKQELHVGKGTVCPMSRTILSSFQQRRVSGCIG